MHRVDLTIGAESQGAIDARLPEEVVLGRDQRMWPKGYLDTALLPIGTLRKRIVCTDEKLHSPRRPPVWQPAWIT